MLLVSVLFIAVAIVVAVIAYQKEVDNKAQEI